MLNGTVLFERKEEKTIHIVLDNRSIELDYIIRQLIEQKKKQLLFIGCGMRDEGFHGGGRSPKQTYRTSPEEENVEFF